MASCPSPPPAPELLTGAAGLLQILDEFRIKNGGVDDPYYSAMRGALEELEIEERKEGYDRRLKLPRIYSGR